MKHAIRFYAVLLKCYPSGYQKAFGAQMMQTFIDHYEDVERLEGRVSMRFWLSTLADEIQNIARQHAVSMTKESNFLKISVAKLVLAAVLLLPLYAIFSVLLVNLSLALPHPHVEGLVAAIALAALLLLLPGVLSVAVGYLLASALVSVFPRRKASRS